MNTAPNRRRSRLCGGPFSGLQPRAAALGLLLVALASRPVAAQHVVPSAVTTADSALVGRILLAEDRRDSTDVALSAGASHPNAHVRTIAWRARHRIRDPKFAARDSLPPLPPPPVWPEPAWRVRYRALTARRDACGAMRAALADSVWPVRLRAAALLRESCAGDDSIAATLNRWVNALPADASRRAPGEVSWQAAAHGLVALARIQPAQAGTHLRRFAAHPQWQVRMYAARAAALLADTSHLRALAYDSNDNVKEVAIESLVKLIGHAGDTIYLDALGAEGPQAVRAAAIALKGSTHPRVESAQDALSQWAAKQSESVRDVRLALLDLLNRSASEDPVPLRESISFPPDAVALALGRETRLCVTMSRATGGGSFVVRLRGDVAPIMAARVLELAQSGYYDNTTWHRTEHDFVVQGLGHGDNEYVGYSRYFRDELGTVPHARGTVGMSTRGHDTGDAQWFINLRDNLRLGADYTVFAEVISGMDVVDSIMEGDVVARVEVLTTP